MITNPPEKPKKPLPDYARYSGIALQMVIIILLGTFLGVKMDHWMNNHFPLFTLLFILLSVGIALYTVIKGLL